MIRVLVKKRKTRAGHDTVVVERGPQLQVLRAWDQPAAPHELVHAAVEQVFPLRGFVRLLAAGVRPAEIAGRDAPPEAHLAEALTNAFQYELWGLHPPDDDVLRAFVQPTFAAHQRPPPGAQPLARCRDLLADLTARWATLGPGETLELELPLHTAAPFLA